MTVGARTFIGTVLASIALAATPAAAETATTSDWKYSVMPYFYATSMTGTTQAGPNVVPFSVRFGDLIQKLSWGAMGNFNAQNNEWAVNVDLMYAKLGDTGPKGEFDVHLAQGIYAGVVAKRIQQYAEIYVGARFVAMDLTADSNAGPAIHVSTGLDWVDPIIGFRVNAPISDKVRFNFMADVGGFGIGADYDIQVWPSLQIKLGQGKWRADLGWRINYLKYSNDKGPAYVAYQNTLYGPTLGATYTF